MLEVVAVLIWILSNSDFGWGVLEFLDRWLVLVAHSQLIVFFKWSFEIGPCGNAFFLLGELAIEHHVVGHASILH